MKLPTLVGERGRGREREREREGEREREREREREGEREKERKRERERAEITQTKLINYQLSQQQFIILHRMHFLETLEEQEGHTHTLTLNQLLLLQYILCLNSLFYKADTSHDHTTNMTE